MLTVCNSFFSKPAVIKRKLKKTIKKKISTFQEGEVGKVVGSITYAGKVLTAPLSGRKCVYYQIKVEVIRFSGPTASSRWHDIINEEVASDVVIKNGSDYALIETGLVKAHLIPDEEYYCSTRNDVTPKLEEYLKKHGRTRIGLFRIYKSLRFAEGVLEEGEIIGVAGKGNWKRKDQINLKIPSSRILVMGPDGNEPLYLSDDPETTESENT